MASRVTLPPPPPEIPRLSAVEHLAPRFRVALLQVLDELRTEHWPPLVFETLRTDARQQWLHGMGRSYSDGRGVVTHSRDADETWHGFGLAADVVHARAYWSAPSEFWTALGAAARRCGLVWGGDWPGFPDRPHLQWGGPMRRSPSPRAARLRESGGLPAVWAEVGAI